MHRASLSGVVSAPASRLLRVVPRPAGLALAAAVGAAGLVAGVPAPAQAAAATTFTYTGAEQTYPIPDGTTALVITAVGASGHAGNNFEVGGPGAVVTASVSMTALPAGTTTLYVEVGGPGALAVGGFNGGGSTGVGGGGGGGASDVRTTSITTVPDSALTPANDSRLVVAGGGAGGGGASCGAPGGTAGDTSVTGPGNGGNGNDAPCGGHGGDGGLGGTAGGTGGAGTATFDCPGGNGSLGQGGAGSCFGGGGGGGGYYGGGAGGFGGGGGGGGGAGSSFWVTGATNTSMSEDTTGVPEVTITPVFGPLKVTTTSLPDATGGSRYTATLAASGGEPPYSWSVTAGSLPPGLHLDSSTGVISGTPDVTGTYDFTVTVTDSESPAVKASQALSISVSGPVVTALSPDHGSQFGAGVRIRGTGLACPPGSRSCRVSVSFGSNPGLVVFVTSTEIAVVAPQGTGTVTVTVTVGGVSSQATAATEFTYEYGFGLSRFLP